jgi:hypothetical protein
MPVTETVVEASAGKQCRSRLDEMTKKFVGHVYNATYKE